MILYGYISLFVVAFPLAPLLGLVYNLVEIKVDSYKLLNNCARPVPRGAQDIGAWLKFLNFITLLSIITNLGIVIFTDTGFKPDWSTEEKVLLFFLLEVRVPTASVPVSCLQPLDLVLSTHLTRCASTLCHSVRELCLCACVSCASVHV